MYDPTLEIPASFRLFDSACPTNNSFCNVKDLQDFRRNHNILIAKRIKRPIMTMVYSPCVTFKDPNKLIGILDIKCSPATQSLKVKIRACKSYLASEEVLTPSLYFRPIIPGEAWFGEPASMDITTAHTSTEADLGNYSEDIILPVSRELIGPRNYREMGYQLLLAANCPYDDNNVKHAGLEILDVGYEWIELAGGDGANNINDVIYFSDPSIGTKTIGDYATVGGNPRYYLYQTFNTTWPVPGVTTASIVEVQGIDIYSMCIYENEITQFELEEPL